MVTQTGQPYLGVRKQIIMSAPSRLLVERYLSPKGIRLMRNAKTNLDKAKLWSLYGKNRYRRNPDAIPCRNKIGGVKIITHSL